ncbi:MAG: antitermination protein NusG [Gammaproteobacteria bacterium]|nr:antitermination protein NusG [Gammaproteobacteria bacterium]
MDFMGLFDYAVRWGHYLFGITWIGLLYYFNFVQGGYMAAASDEAKVDAFTKLVPKALWWFRWGAAFTFLTGLYLLYLAMTGLSVDLLLAALMATLMFLNVWGIIWPNQKIVIASNESVRDGGEADPAAAGAAAKALLASRTNTFFSMPMLFLMGSHGHFMLGAVGDSGLASMTSLWVGIVIIAAIEANAIWGKTMVLTTVRGVIVSSLVLTVVMGLVVANL